ncbi:POK9 protein, partial [Sitta europaea]|nr:POK9 protein [Sitta europaea]
CLSSQAGKRTEQRERPPRSDTSSGHSPSNSSNASNLQPATAGSLGLDLAIVEDIDLLTSAPHKLPTDVNGPLIINNATVGALVFGRSSASMMGLIVLPGVIDADYTGTIYVMAYTLAPPIRISKGTRIAQLVPLPQLTKTMSPVSHDKRMDKGFGSTGGIAMLTLDLSSRPKKKVTIMYQDSNCTLTGLLDTGADCSIVDPAFWPENWPLLASTTAVTGVGGLTLAKKSPTVTVCIDGKIVNCVLSIVPLPDKVQCLIGRDVLAQIGMVL